MKRRRFSRKRRFSKRKKSLSKRVKKVERAVRRARPEVKYVEYAQGVQLFDWTGTSSYVTDLMAGISQGTTDYGERIGDRIRVLGMMIKMTLYNNSTYQFIGRIVVFKLKDNPDAIISTASLGNLVLESAVLGTSNAVNAFRDFDNAGAFTILWDKPFVVNVGGTSGSSGTAIPTARHIRHYIRCNFDVQYKAATSYTTKNGLYIMFLADTANTNVHYAAYNARIYYVDS